MKSRKNVISTKRGNERTEKSDIHKYRKEIDRIDEQIVALLVKRLGVVKKIGKVKLENREQITNNRREQEIYEKIYEIVPEDLYDSIQEIYKSIISKSRELQSKL